MVRKQIVIRPEQERALEARANALGMSQSAAVRAALDEWLGAPATARGGDAAWDRALGVMYRAEQMRTGSGDRTWTREELHER
jgi:hypothetical protein